MYVREVESQTLTFAVSGKLWNRSLVMIDSQTESLWSHLLGEAMRGEMEGTQLETVASLMTDWETWRAAHPETTVMNMSRTARFFNREVYTQPSMYVIGMKSPAASRAWSFAGLREQPIVNDHLGDRPVLVVFDVDSSGAMVFRRRLDEQVLRDHSVEVPEGVLTFVMRDGQVFDEQTASRWHPQTGLAEAGPLAGVRLSPDVGIISYLTAWETFYPNSTYWESAAE